MKGKTLEKFGKQQIIEIEDVTDFVIEQRKFVKNNKLEKLLVPNETIFIPNDEDLATKIGLSKPN